MKELIMKIELVKTKEADGDWFKIKVDGSTQQCIGFGKYITEEEALKRAEEIYEFYVQNKGNEEVLMSETVIN
jgi:predicted RNase H-like HicB family nuclease